MLKYFKGLPEVDIAIEMDMIPQQAQEFLENVMAKLRFYNHQQLP